MPEGIVSTLLALKDGNTSTIFALNPQLLLV